MIFSLVVLALASAGPSEPPGLARLVKAADKATVERALVDAGLVEVCKGALASADLRGLQCRLAVARAAAARPLNAAADVDDRAGVAAAALAAGTYVDTWVPKAPEPGLRRQKLDAHLLACDVAFRAVADLEALPASHPGSARAREVVAAASAGARAGSVTGLRDGACACAQRSADMAVAADAAPDEQAALQGLLTRQRCNATGELKIAERKGPTSTFDAGNKELKKVADAASPEGRLIELARGRSVELDRCTDKISPEGRTKDVEKLNACACGVVKRWSLPLKKDEPKATAKLPLAGAVVLPIAVEAGKLTSCGPVEGLAP